MHVVIIILTILSALVFVAAVALLLTVARMGREFDDKD